MTWQFDVMLMKTGKMKNVDCSHCNMLKFCSSFASEVISEHLICKSNPGGHASHCTIKDHFLRACLFVCLVGCLFVCFVCLFCLLVLFFVLFVWLVGWFVLFVFNFKVDTVYMLRSNTSICSLSTSVKTDLE